MRPTGEVTHALLAAAGALASPGHGGTLREITALACVGRQAAAYTVPKLAARGHLEVVSERRVDYRNKPVFEYALPSKNTLQPPHPGLATGAVEPSPQTSQTTSSRLPLASDLTWSDFV
jgi:hypothetical protein